MPHGMTHCAFTGQYQFGSLFLDAALERFISFGNTALPTYCPVAFLHQRDALWTPSSAPTFSWHIKQNNGAQVLWTDCSTGSSVPGIDRTAHVWKSPSCRLCL